ncbi:hypothetical protein GCM10010168_29140 [Actinoplanes ianthinogenes]|uniref:Uncharacterized protein n=1 Tax=Actinoplanes ianthinogenes TaxID=122358 RepID=A0ABM7LLA9_9ACTN|nr:ThiF family adenylyltransferase [Actinoplanes ianthinogenes]BCJ40056.1 hypothetical protein Aiant_07130 [Actinoplanes ianthinogenes]GGR09977.1 hypothetical protein GCM10010168_29140 [Actinoplanes ianthinogenes]
MTGGLAPTQGQKQAERQLSYVERLYDGAVRVVRTHPRAEATDWLRIDLELACDVPPEWTPLTDLEPTEAVQILVPPDYPFHLPDAAVEHDRFAGLPHVLWSQSICLYLSPNDWDPGQGMQGFVERLVDWFRHVAEGTLTSGDVVPEPPLTGPSPVPDVVLVRGELPAALEANPEPWTAWAAVEMAGDQRWEVRQWLDADAARTLTGPAFLALVLGLPEPAGFRFPRRLGDLLEGFDRQRVDLAELFRLFQQTMAANLRRFPPDAETGTGPPMLVFVVTPAPPGSAAPSRVAYLAAWIVDISGLADGTATAHDPVFWLRVLDQRPRFTTRRDVRRPASWLRERRVLLLGCGGLGAPIAEYCARAGVAELHLVDDGVVMPGILVRQPYADADFGRPKVFALAERLAEIRSGTKFDATYGDAISYLRAGPGPDLDLIIDATAARAVAVALERFRWEDDRPHPPLLSVMVGHDSARGVATLAMPGAGGAGSDILRRLAVEAADDDSLLDVLDDFYPDLPRTALFQPEPGCSDPTYVGSAADLAAFSAWLLNDALTILGGERHPAEPRRWATVLRAPSPGRTGPAADRRHWPEDVVTVDAVHGYQVRMEPSAYAEVRNEVIRMAGRRGPRVETGGLLLGQIDHASRVVWVTEARGLPAGSDAFAGLLRLDPRAARAAVEERRRLTRNLVSFIGAWHTHPRNSAAPSPIDLDAMREMTDDTRAPALLMIFGGEDPARWRAWIGGRGRPEWCTALFLPFEEAAA